MTRTRGALPDVSETHLSALRIVNDTGYDGRAIRRLLVRCLRALSMSVRGAVRVCYSSQPDGHHGAAALGDGPRLPGLNMVLSLPRDPSRMRKDQLARLVLHEILHWRGVSHEDMTDNQRYCRGPEPEWARDVLVLHRERVEPTKEDLRAKRLEHARAMWRRADAQERRWNNIANKWKHRTRALEAAAERSSRKTGVVDVPSSPANERSLYDANCAEGGSR